MSSRRRRLQELCAALVDAGGLRLDNLPSVSLGHFRDLQLLTLGQQLIWDQLAGRLGIRTSSTA